MIDKVLILFYYSQQKIKINDFLFYVDYMVELHQLHPVFTQWAASEPELAKSLQAIASAIESSANAHQKLLDSTVNEEREYVTYIDAVKDALNRRDAMQHEYEVTIDELTKRKTERDQVSYSFKKFQSTLQRNNIFRSH